MLQRATLAGVIGFVLVVGLFALPMDLPGPAKFQPGVYYVSPAGNDTQPGTLTQPWKTIQKAADTLVAGESVFIRSGTYYERVIPQHSGSAVNRLITYAAFPGENVTIDGAGTDVPTDEGLFYIVNQDYLKVSGLHIINSTYAGILVDRAGYIELQGNHTDNTGSSGIGVWGSHHVLVDGNEVERACSNGMQESLTVAGTDTFTVRHNRVHNAAGYSKEGICIKDGSSNGVVYRNEIYQTAAVGLYVDAWDKHTFSIDVHENVIHDVSAMGIALASEQGGLLEDIRVVNNIAYRNRYAGIWLSGCCESMASHPISGVQITNNTLVENGWEWGGGIAFDVNPAIQHVVVRNNLLSQNLSFQIAVDPVVPASTLAIDHNLIDGYRDGEGEVYGDMPVVGEARLVSAAAADFHLRPTSPAIDRGSVLSAPPDDFDGAYRPQDGDHDGIAAFDIGAYEFAARWVYLPIVWRKA
jgi:hypothetical protein